MRAGWAAAQRRRRRAGQAGFTLIELMVVVVLISIIAVIATPAMRVARDDRLAFDYARRIEQMIDRARTRAAGRGGA
ncbi:MAG TPA: prepilin-type N-terminal cleavage/methylation domain-containing protein, partial [Labilithrix sp.]|nr:prepilin-type N-terminal cleavage/methylation domain-containing protein [Labilithrix sp.]